MAGNFWGCRRLRLEKRFLPNGRWPGIQCSFSNIPAHPSIFATRITQWDSQLTLFGTRILQAVMLAERLQRSTRVYVLTTASKILIVMILWMNSRKVWSVWQKMPNPIAPLIRSRKITLNRQLNLLVLSEPAACMCTDHDGFYYDVLDLCLCMERTTGRKLRADPHHVRPF